VSEQLAARLLEIAGVRAIVYRGGQTRRLVLAEAVPASLDLTYDLREVTWLDSIRDAFGTMFQSRNRVMRLIGHSRQAPGALVEVVMDEAPMAAHLRSYSVQILRVSALISILTAGLVFLTLQWRLVGPMGRITRSMVVFRKNPGGPRSVVVPSQRGDEIGVAERELEAMQTDLRASLRQNQRLAELGTAVSKINHDLRNILATAMLVSDRIALIDDPEVQRLTPPLIKAIDRAVGLCNDTLRYGRADEAPPNMADFDLYELVDDIAAFARTGPECCISTANKVVAPFPIHADRDQLFRALLNLARNGAQAMAGEDGRGAGLLSFTANRLGTRVTLDVSDTGPGLPDTVREQLFRPFTNGNKPGGTGLGLAIARDIARSHGGDIELVESNSSGTRFRLEFPHA
jgi:signal transduction histidine kinase